MNIKYSPVIQAWQPYWASVPQIDFVVLIGSQLSGTADAASDWDLAIALAPQLDAIARYDLLADLQIQLAALSGVAVDDLDLIDLARSGLAMREQVANHGLVLHGGDTLAWSRFMVRTWRDLEMQQWEQQHAA
ncbi:nucleotidyltransferase domain-containing protein [Chitinibacter sp. SCUT-21]|uniref:type VII toxin-antitoxin system MntA family adenylyltransferase antitoxin n=1 Tax=Chitinibacter sp. SCUT-21 TaxID=2970891 RepID=UPI0035A70670